MLIVNGTAKFILDGREIAVDSNELEVVHETTDKRQMGAEYGYIIILDNNDITVKWHAYEYPEGSLNLVEIFECSADEVIQDFNFDCSVV